MNRHKANIKKVIKAKIGGEVNSPKTKPVMFVREQESLKKKQEIIKKMNFENPGFIKQDRAFVADVPEFGNMDDRETHIIEYRKRIEAFKTDGYVKRETVDYDVIVCISSYNRYDKLIKLLDQLYGQGEHSKYTFKIVFLDDGSTDPNYEKIKTAYPEMDYEKNNKNNGRDLYWYTVTQLWQAAKKYTSHCILMIDDDFILANNFMNLICDLFFHLKNENNSIVGIAPHLHSYHAKTLYMAWWYNTYSCDGICLFDRYFIESFNFRLQPVSRDMLESVPHAHGWSQISTKINNENKIAYKTKVSIAFHDGNDESKLGKNNPRKSKANTHYYSMMNRDYRDLIV